VHPGLRAASAALSVLATAGATGCTLSHASAAYHSPAASVAPEKPSANPSASPSAQPSATPAPPPAVPAGMRRMSVAGRSYLLSVPKNVRRPAPLVVALGGVGSSAQKVLGWFRLQGIASATHSVVAYPDPVKGVWNAGGCCFGSTSNDIGFMTKMRAQIAREVPLDPERQVLMGYSNGGMLAYYAACADVHWTGIVVLGASLTTRCTPSHPFTITNVNGELDAVVRWDGGYAGYTHTVMPAVWQIDQEFAGVFGCRPAQRTLNPDNEIYTYAGCHGGVFVRDVRVARLLHHWPLREIDGYDMGPVLWRMALG
jgi:polyhydroxybutyrate depolymerase